MRSRVFTMLLLSLAPAACSSFSTVRSAAVRPGPSVMVQGSATTPMGDVTGWFWSLDCVERCARGMIGGDLGLAWGFDNSGSRPIAIGVGVNGLMPYLDGYLQLANGPRPFGLGARLGLPLFSWQEHQVYARYDIPLRTGTRLLLNPALFIHRGTAPNGESPGSFIGFVQGVGVEFEGAHMSFTPSVAVVAGRAQRTSYGEKIGPEGSVFGTASLALTLHRRRALSGASPRISRNP